MPDGDGYVKAVTAVAGTGVQAVTSSGNVTLSGLDATTSAKGVVRFATPSEISSGTGGVVVSAADLKGAEYTLPIASAGTLGGIKVGNGLAIDGGGILSASISGGVVYKGTTDITGTAPAKVDGHQYLNTVAGTADSSWTGIGGQSVAEGVMVITDGSTWSVIQSGDSGVVGITGTAPIEVDNTDATQPVIKIASATESVVGASRFATDIEIGNGTAGVVVQASQLKTAIEDLDPLPTGVLAGDLMQWDPSGGGSWTVSNTLDGGSF